MHENSIRAFSDSMEQLSRRERECYGVQAASLRPMTDREVMERLQFTDPNSVRPRLTELVADLWAEEVDTVPDHVTGKQVRRLVAVQPWKCDQKLRALREANNENQLQLAFA
jgi:hypothetical protein